MAIEKQIVITAKTADANKNIEKTNNELNKTNESTTTLTKNLDGLTGGMVSKFKGFTGGLKSIATGFKGVGAAIAASGLGLLVITIAAITAAFNSSEEGQNKFAKIMGVIGSVVGNVMDVISDLGEIIIGVLSGDSEAIKSATAFGKKIFDVVGLPIKNIISVVQTAANVIKGLSNDGIDGALTALENGVEDVKGNFNEAKDAILSAKNALKEFGEEALREAQIAQQIADDRAKADKTDRELIVERAEANRKVAELREKALDRERFNTKERIAFLNEASKVEEEITNKEIQSAILRRDAIIKENNLSKSNKEALNAEEEAKAAVIELETKRLSLQKALTSQISSLKQQEKAENKAISDARKAQLAEEQKKAEEKIKKDIEDENKRALAIEAIRKSFAEKLEDLEDKTELQRIERQQSRALLELETLNATEQQKLEAIKYFESLKTAAIKNEEIARTEKEAADKKEREDIAEQERQFKENEYQNTFNNLQNILSSGGGKLKKIAQALAIGDVVRSASQSVSETVSSISAANAKAVAASPLTGGHAFCSRQHY